MQEYYLSEEAKLTERLKQMFEQDAENLKVEDRENLQHFVKVFAKSSDDLGCTKNVNLTINTGSVDPIRQLERQQHYSKLISRLFSHIYL